jgi:hypothetical protein
LIEQNPSLKSYQHEAVTKAYQLALLLIGRQTPLNPKQLPSQCPYSFEQITNISFPEDLDSL